MEIDRNGFEVLDRAQSLELLGTASLGRVAVSTGALPTVLPVNFLLDGERILFRSGRGTKLEAALRNTVVAFEVDDFDPLYHSGWSVVVTGVASELSAPDELADVSLLPIPHWGSNGDGHLIAVSTELVTGRRLQRARAVR